MTTIIKKAALGLAIAAALGTSPLLAGEAGDFKVRVGAANVDPTGDSGNIDALGANAKVEADDAWSLGLSFTYMLTDNIGVGLLHKPKIVYMDEPTVGMTPEELDQMMGIIRKVHRELGLAIYLIEHRLKMVMELCERIQTLVFGEVIAEGTPDEIQNNAKVIEAYLGRGAANVA